MKKILCSLLMSCAVVALMAQGKSSFLVADTCGNSYLVKSLMFQRVAQGKSYSWSSPGFNSSNLGSFDIGSIQFIARIKDEMMSATSDEITGLLEDLSGSDNADAEVVAAALQNNENVEEAYTVDGNDVVVRESGSQYYTAYSVYDLQPAFSEEQLPEEAMQLLNAPKSSRKSSRNASTGELYGKVAIFNFFSDDERFSLQNCLVGSIYTRFDDNGYDVTLYNKEDFTEAKLSQILECNHDSRTDNDYAAIIIFSHGVLRNRSTSVNQASAQLITGEEVVEDNICDRWYNTRDGKYYKMIPMSMNPGEDCILYMGACYGTCWGQSLFRQPNLTYVGWNGVNCISQAHAAIVFDKMLFRGLSLSEALQLSFTNDPVHLETKLDYNQGKAREAKLHSAPSYSRTGEFYEKYPELSDEKCFEDVSVKFSYNNDVYVKTDGWSDEIHTGTDKILSVSGRITGNGEFPYPAFYLQLLPVTGGKRISEGRKGRDYLSELVLLNPTTKTFSASVRVPPSLREGVYYINASVRAKIIKTSHPRYVVISPYFNDNYALPVLADEDTQKPQILGADNQPVEKITLPAGSSKTFVIQGYEGHTFNAVSLHKEIVDVSVTGKTLTVTGVSEDSTYIGVYDEQNRQMTAALVKVENEVSVHEWVDLGLPSGTLWATCNVGANSPEEYGDYFAWGETEPKGYYDWSTYKWCNGSSDTMTKYCIRSEYGYNGFTDGKTELDPEDDAAAVNWGGSWRMPTRAQLEELRGYCTREWTTLDGVNGILVTGPNGNTIFLPAVGDRLYGVLPLGAGGYGYYWSSSLDPTYDLNAYNLSFGSGYWGWNGNEGRSHGRPVRAVCGQEISLVANITLDETLLSLQKGDTHTLTATVMPVDAENKTVAWESSNEAVATVSTDGLVTAVAEGSCVVTCSAVDGSGVYAECQVTVTSGTTPDPGNHAWVDLGLPSGTLWATCNVGANSPEEYGDYFVWGETAPKDYYGSTYFDSDYNKYNHNGGLTELLPEDDAATKNWGSPWHMPTFEQMQELLDNCTREWTTQGGVNGTLVTGPNGNTIFLPAAGHRWGDELGYTGSHGDYWSSSLYPGLDNDAYYLDFGSGYWYWDLGGRSSGLSVRAVRP